MSVQRMSAREARANFSDLLGRVFYTREPVIIEKKGRPFAVVISPEDYDAFQKQREKGFLAIDELRARNSDKDADAVQRDVTAVVEDVRQETYDESAKSTSSRH